MAHFESLGPSLFRIVGRVHGYLLRGPEGVAVVDPGPGAWIDHLDEIGITHVDWVLATHFHRDSLHHAGSLIARGAKLAAPETEHHLIEGADTFWQTARTFRLYNCDSSFSCLRQGVPMQAGLKGDTTFNAAGLTFRVFDMPGHTAGHVALTVELDGRRLAFLGDNLADASTVHDLHDFHYDYMGFGEGAARLLEHLPALRAEKPALLLPAHGEPQADADQAFIALETNLRRHVAAVTPHRIPRPSPEPRAVSPHVHFLNLTTYAIIADNGKGFFWDWGYVPLEKLDHLRTHAGLKTVDVLTFSHYHDDHICRAVELAHFEAGTQHPRGAQVWCHRDLHDILTQPLSFRLPCLWPQPIPIDRMYGDETIEWESYRLEFFSFPGQTFYHVGMVVEIDGQRMAFTGDNIWKPQPGFPPHGPIIPRNRYLCGKGHAYCAQQLLDRGVTMICPGHNDAFEVTRGDLEAYRAWGEEAEASIRALCPAEPLGYDPWWLRVDPFHLYIRPGEGLAFKVVLESPFAETVELSLRPACGAALAVTPVEQTLTLRHGERVEVPFHASAAAAAAWPVGRRTPLSFDLTVAGVPWGEFGEGLFIAAP